MTLMIDGEKIEDVAIQQEAERLRPDYEKAFTDMEPKEREEQLLDWSKENVIERVLISQEAKRNGDKIPQAEVESVLTRLKEQYNDQKELYRNFNAKDDDEIEQAIESQMRVEQTLNNVSKDLPQPSQADIEKYYEKNKEQYKSAEQVRVAHIVKYVNWQTNEATAFEDIKKAHDELKKGVAFESVVDKHTDCQDSGGDLGYVAKGQMVEEFEDVVFHLSVGQVSDIFRTRFGFHIAKLYDRKPPVIAGLKEVTKEIEGELKEQRREEAINEFIDKLKSKAKIEEI